MVSHYFIFSTICVFVFSHKIYSQKPLPTIQTDRPDMTETPFVVPTKHFQIETGWSYEKINNKEESYHHPSALMKYGMNENVELRLITELTTEKIENQSSFQLNPVLVGLKVKLWEEKGFIPKTSLIAHLSIPFLSSTNPSPTYYAPSFRFTLQHSLSEKIYLGYNLGALWDSETEEPTFLYTLAGGSSLTEKIGAYLEFYGFAPQKEMANHRIAGGFTYLIKRNIMVDLSGGFGLTENTPKHYIALGFSARWPN